MADQRRIIAENRNRDLTAVPQVWALYKEVQEYYDRGMRVPDDVTLLWCDDNWGNIRRLPTPEERARPGGAGIYYHFDYVGGPRTYKWLNTDPIPKIWEQMHLAWRYGATRIWIVNVGDIKPMEFPIQFFLDYAWDPAALAGRAASLSTRAPGRNASSGPSTRRRSPDSSRRYTKYNGRRKPELLEPATYSLVNYREAETVVGRLPATRAQGRGDLRRRCPPRREGRVLPARAAPDQGVGRAQRAVRDGRQEPALRRAGPDDDQRSGRPGSASCSTQDAAITRDYNETLAGGKWNHMMDQTHIGYTYWKQPVRNAMPAVQRDPGAGGGRDGRRDRRV